MRQQDRHLVVRQRVLARIQQLVPDLLLRRREEGGGDELVSAVEFRAARRADRAHEHGEKLQCARHLPPAEVARSRVAPDVRGEGAARPADLVRHRDQLVSRDATLLFGCAYCVFVQERPELFDEEREGRLLIRAHLAEIVAPVHPVFHELLVHVPLVNDDLGHRQQHHGLGARVRAQPIVRDRGGVGETHIDRAEFRALLLGVDDALRVRIEVVPGFEVGGQQQDELRVLVVGARTVGAGPERVPHACARRADIRV